MFLLRPLSDHLLLSPTQHTVLPTSVDGGRQDTARQPGDPALPGLGLDVDIIEFLMQETVKT